MIIGGVGVGWGRPGATICSSTYLMILRPDKACEWNRTKSKEQGTSLREQDQEGGLQEEEVDQNSERR